MHVHEAAIETPADWWGQIRKPLGGGRSPGANFYRPGLMLVNAALRAAFGWEPLGYHVFDLMLHAVNGLLVALLVRQMARGFGVARPERLAFASLLLFALHPIGVEDVPAIARVSDLLLAAFFLNALLVVGALERPRVATGPGAGRSAARRMLLFALAFAPALATKETGILLVGVAPLYVLLLRADLRPADRVRRALVLAAPAAAIAAGFLLVRAAVLDDFVAGYEKHGGLVWNANIALRALPFDLLVPGFAWLLRPWVPQFQLSALEWLAVLGPVAAAGAIAAARAPSWRRRLQQAAQRARAPLRLLALCLAVVACFAALLSAGRFYDRRLLYTAIAFWSPVVALGALALWDRARDAQHPAWRRALAAGLLVAGCTLFGVQSPLLHRYDDWRQSGEANRLLSESIRAQWESLPEGAQVWVADLPFSITLDPMRERMNEKRAATFGPATESLEAWAEASWPDRHIGVHRLGVFQWAEPVRAFRCDCAIADGELSFDVPEATIWRSDLTAYPSPFRVRAIGDRRYAVSRAPGGAPRLFVLVFDGERPFLVAAADLRVSEEDARASGAAPADAVTGAP